MRDTWNAAKVGLLVVAIAAASFGVYKLIDERSGGGDGYTVWVVFTDAQGLVPKSRVLIAGIQVGYIEDIRLWGTRARIDIRMNPDVELHQGATVGKRSASILGESMLVLAPGDRTQPKLEDGAQIMPEQSSPSTDQILTTVGEIADSVKRVTTQLERTFGTDEGGRQMSAALRNLSEALDGINRTIQQNEEVVGRTLRNVEGITEQSGPQIAAILENARVATEEVRELIVENRGEIDSTISNADDTVQAVERAANQLETVLAEIHEVTDRTARGEGTIGRLTSDERLIDEVEGVVEGVGDIVGGISRLQTIVELRSEYNFLANTFKSYVGLRIQPSEDRYYLFELINDPRGRTEFEQTTVSTSPPLDGVPPTYTQTRVTTRDSFRFSLLFAKRVYFATFRFGLIESTGGLGIDLHLLDDRFELTSDLFAFGEQSLPRMRARLAMEVVSRLWLHGGVDDVLNDSRDFFLGAFLRFNDEDLKSILPFVGGVASGGT